MLINKISNSFQSRTSFKGYDHKVDNDGFDVLRFNYPFDYDNQRCFIEFYNVKADDTKYAGYELIRTKNPPRIELAKGGVDVDLTEVLKLKKNEPCAYKVIITDKNENVIWQGADTGVNMNFGEYVLLGRNGTNPMSKGGIGMLTMPDIHIPGAYYAGYNSAKPNEIIYDKERQKKAEQTIRTYNNHLGGSLAGIELDLKRLKNEGIKVVYMTPFASGDNTSYHGYWNENNNQLCIKMGNLNNFDSFVKKLFRNGQVAVYDGTFTSEGVNGIHAQYALRWGNKDPFARYLFTMDDDITLGIISLNDKNQKFEIINSPIEYIQDEKGKVTIKDNLKYDYKKDTYIQLINKHNEDDKLSNNTYQDAGIPYKIRLSNPSGLRQTLNLLNDYNKTAEKPIRIDSADGLRFIGKYDNFNIDNESRGAFMWDANKDLFKRNHSLSGYNAIIAQKESSPSAADYERKLYEIGCYMNIDMDTQTIRHWFGRYKNDIVFDVAKSLQNVESVDDIYDLINSEKLPTEAFLSSEAFENIKEDSYLRDLNSSLSKDDITIKAITQLPLDSMEEINATVCGILSTPYFINRASSREYIGKTRFELMKEGNPNLLDEYKNVYLKVDGLYNNELKKFAHDVIAKINETSQEKLLDESGNYTEYGENVIEIIGRDITKFVLLKAIANKNFEFKVDEEGIIHYDYDKINQNTELSALGINDTNTKDEALHLYRIIKNGLQNINQKDIDDVANAFSKQLDGTTNLGFRLAKVIYKNSALGMFIRLDAIKDYLDMDAVRSKYDSFDDAWDALIQNCKYLVDAVKKENPSAVITAEITDITDLLRKTCGDEFLNGRVEKNRFNDMVSLGIKYRDENEAILRFIQETGITTEAAYPYFFSSVINQVSKCFEDGGNKDSIHSIVNSFNRLITTRDVDYIKNLYTFIGNHDKTRAVHNFSLNLEQFYGDFLPINNNGNLDYKVRLWDREQALLRLSGVDNLKDMPLEYRLNVNNVDYFMTVSPKAIAMSTLLNDSINQCLNENDLINSEEVKYLKKALADLTDGKYLDYGKRTSQPIINIEELNNMHKAVSNIFEMAKSHGLELSEIDTKNFIEYITNKASTDEIIYRHLVQGNLDDSSTENIGKARYVLSGANGKCDEEDFTKYSLYTVCLAAVIKDALKESNTEKKNYDAISEAIKDFVKKYDKATVKANSSNLVYFDEPDNIERKNGFAMKQIDVCVDMLIEHAKYLAKKDDVNNLFVNEDDINTAIYAHAIEPGVQKMGICLSILSALPGFLAYFAGDELGATGGELKSKNIYNQNRNARKVSEYTEGPKKELRQRIKEFFDYSMSLRNQTGVDALKAGTPYILNTSSSDVPAFLYQDSNGNMAISIINVAGYQKGNRVNYFELLGLANNESRRQEAFSKTSEDSLVSVNSNNPFVPVQKAYKLDHIELPMNISIPVGTVFKNAIDGCDDLYEVVINNGRRMLKRIKNEYGEQIVINGQTARNGVMVLKHIVKSFSSEVENAIKESASSVAPKVMKQAAKVAFKGNNLNKQYNISYPAYYNYDLNNKKEKTHKFSMLAE